MTNRTWIAGKLVWILPLIGAVSVLLILFAWFGRSKEPSYAGRSLSSWLRVLHNPKSLPAQQQAAQGAIRGMGTNLIPALLAATDQTDDGFLVRFVRPAEGLGFRCRLPMHLAWSSAGLLLLSTYCLDQPTRRQAAQAAFSAYVDELDGIRGAEQSQRRLLRLGQTFFSVSDFSFELLTRSLTNAEPRVRASAAALAGFRSGMPTNLIGCLAERIPDPDPRVRFHALSSLSHFRKHGSMVVPLLARGLRDDQAHIRRIAIHSLRLFGPEARPALPELKALAERDWANRQFAVGCSQLAVDCIRGIDEEEADRLAMKLQINR